MSRKFKYWLDSGANIHSMRQDTVTLEEMGLTDEEFDEMPDEQKEELFRDYAFERAEWGWEEV